MRLQTLLEARWIFAILAVFAIVGSLLTVWLSLFFLLLLFCTLAFFRDPDRTVPADPNLVVAAADGTVTDIVELDESEVLKAKARRVGIFLSIIDVHTNRAPIDGRIIYRKHREGLCVDARRPDCETHRSLGENRRRIKKRRALWNDSLRFANRNILAS